MKNVRNIVCLLLISSVMEGCDIQFDPGFDNMVDSQTSVRNSVPVTDTPTPIPVSKPDVKVTDAFRKEINIYDVHTVYRYPKVSISGVDTSKINQTIEKDLDDRLFYDPESDSYYGSAVDYEYYISDNYVSIVAALSDVDVDDWKYKVYNISIDTGRRADDKAIVAEYGLSDDVFFDTVREVYKKFNAWSDTAGDSMVNEYNNKNLNRVSYKYIKPYLNSKGHLCFVGYVNYIGGAGEGDCLFDATDCKALGWAF